MARGPGNVELSVVLPCLDEEGSLPPLLDELDRVLGRSGRSFEIVCVDDASRDGTADVVRRLAASRPHVRLLRHAARCGQSAALASGFRVARGAVILTLDADGQNDPADLPRLLSALDAGADAACGVRACRRDA
ncbi:MAG: glycosyltransferase, partial [Planctomycetes bacterium]|nr:glycosyltransferase [Planctomycetota bacterium]